MIELERLLTESIGDYLTEGFTVQRTGKSAAIRLCVPVINFHASFESQIDEVRQCFIGILKMSEIVKQFNPDYVAGLLNGERV